MRDPHRALFSDEFIIPYNNKNRNRFFKHIISNRAEQGDIKAIEKEVFALLIYIE